MPSGADATASKADGRVRRALSWLTCGDPVLGAGLVLLVAYYVFTRGVFQGKYSGDGLFGFEYLRAIVYEHTLDMKAVVPEWLPYFSQHPVTQHMPNRCPFGPVLLWLPFYLVGCGLAELGRLLHLVGPLKPDSAFHAWMAGLGTLGAVLVGYRQVYVLAERHLGRGAARLAATASVWATPIAWYAVTQPMYQHGAAFGCVALLVERWDATLGGTGWRRAVVLGGLGGLAASMRAQEVLFLLLPAGEIVSRLARGPARRAWLTYGVVCGAAALVAFSPQLYVWWYYTASLSPPQVEPLRLTEPQLLTVLFSTRAGLFPWSPIAYAALVGVLARPRPRHLVWGLVAVFAVEVYICAAAWVPSGAYAYGARRLSDGAVLLGLGVGLLWARVQATRWKRRVVAAFTALCVALTLVTMELQRQQKTKSSGGWARTAGTYLAEFGAPAWLQDAADAVGYPFVQPVGWLFALWYRVPVSTFEGVVGNMWLDRDGQWFTVLAKAFDLEWHARFMAPNGLAFRRGAKEAVVTDGRVRLLLHMFAKEKLTMVLIGQLPDGPVSAAWRGTPCPAVRMDQGVRVEVPEEAVRAGVNEVVLGLPVGGRIRRIEFVPAGPLRR